MVHAMCLVTAVWLLATPAAAAQEPASTCAVLSEADVTALIGTIKKAQPMGQGACSYSGDQRMLSVVRLDGQSPETVQGMMNALKGRVRSPETAQDEEGIGDRAVSAIEKGGGRLTILASRGTTIWSLAVEHVYSNTSLEAQMPKLRELARKAVGP
jgi:hypothetical protein